MDTKAERPLYSRLAFASAIVIVVAVPLAVMPPLTRDIFAIWKATAFSLAVAGLAAAWLIKCRSEGRYSLRVPYYWVPLLALGVAFILATVFSVDYRESMLGSYGRSEGLLIILGYFAVGALIPSALDKDDIDRVLTVWIAIGIPILVYALVQFAGLDPQRWSGAFSTNRVFSTLGNPLFLSGYIVLTLPIAYSRLMRRIDAISLAFVALSLPVLLATYSRSGWVAFAIVTVAFVAVALAGKKRETSYLKSPLVWALLGVIVIGVAMVASISDIWPRIASAFDWKTGTIAARFNLWNLTVRMIAERPLTGYGPETFYHISTRFLDLTQQSIEINASYDRPHSDLLQVAFSAGVVGLAAYLAFICKFFQGAMRFIMRRQTAYTAAGLALGVFGYILAIQFFFSTVAVTPLMWLAVGMVASLVGAEERTLPQALRPLVAPAVALSSFALLGLHATGLAADMAASKGLDANVAKDYRGAANGYKTASKLYPWRTEYILWMGEELEQTGDEIGAVDAYKRAIENSPLRYEGYAHLALFYYERRDAQNAMDYALKAMERYPIGYDARMVYALVSAINGDAGVAEESLLLLQKIDPQDYRAFYYLGELYASAGDKEKAVEQFGQAQRVAPKVGEIRDAIKRVGGGASGE